VCPWSRLRASRTLLGVRRFTTIKRFETFHVNVGTKSSDDAVAISISGTGGIVGSATSVRASSVGLGRAIQPGKYTVTLRQKTNGNGATAVIVGDEPVYVTAWQILSRTYVGLLAFAGVHGKPNFWIVGN
jgi:hypothetical protein